MQTFKQFLVEFKISYPATYQNIRTRESKIFNTADDYHRFMNNEISYSEKDEWQYVPMTSSKAKVAAAKTIKATTNYLTDLINRASSHTIRQAFGDNYITQASIDSIRSAGDATKLINLSDKRIQELEGMIKQYKAHKSNLSSEEIKRIKFIEDEIKKQKELNKVLRTKRNRMEVEYYN